MSRSNDGDRTELTISLRPDHHRALIAEIAAIARRHHREITISQAIEKMLDEYFLMMHAAITAAGDDRPASLKALDRVAGNVVAVDPWRWGMSRKEIDEPELNP